MPVRHVDCGAKAPLRPLAFLDQPCAEADARGKTFLECVECDNARRQEVFVKFFEFDLLSMLKEVGSSLKEIKAHLHNMNGENFLSFLLEKQLAAEKELRRAVQRRLMLKDMTTCLREALNLEYDTLTVQQQKAERLEMTPSGASPSESQWELVQRFAEFNKTYEQQEEKPRYPFGIVYCLNDVRQGNYVEQYYFTRVRRSTPPAHLHIKPAGEYAVLAHMGTEKSHIQALARMLEHISEASMTIKSDVYVYDMMSYVMQESGDCYSLKYMILVE